MRHRIKKIPNLISNHLLHSNKSTYFYNSKFRYYLAPICVSNALLLVLSLLIHPILDPSTYALGPATAPKPDAGDPVPKVSLSILNNNTALADNATVSTEATAGQVAYIDNTIRINTNNIAKFYVGIQAAPDGSSNLTGTNYKDTITGVGTNISPTNFGDNTWGYSLLNGTSSDNTMITYSTLPAYNSNSPLQYTSEANPSNGNHDLKLTFAAKINANKPGDHYQTKAMVSVAADAKTVTIGDLTQMQQMFPAVCTASSIGENKTLTDTRDGSKYHVGKLGDGKCWMVDNMRIVNKSISSADSDLPEGSTYDVPASSDPWSDTGLETNKVHYAGNTTHGAYYTWYAATAGTGKSSVTSGQAPGSICPKGWRLPTGGYGGEFQALVNKGKSSWTTSNGINGYWLGGTSSSAYGAAFFTASGYIGAGSLLEVGDQGGYWPSTPKSSDAAYALTFYSGDIFPVNDRHRYTGLAVRCIAK